MCNRLDNDSFLMVCSLSSRTQTISCRSSLRRVAVSAGAYSESSIIRIPFTGSVKLRSLLLKSGPGEQTPAKVALVRPIHVVPLSNTRTLSLTFNPVRKYRQPRFFGCSRQGASATV
jgi:hypothetical protein